MSRRYTHTLPGTPPTARTSSWNGSSPAVERLADHPRSGRGVRELGDRSIREIIHGNYTVSFTACDMTSSRSRRCFTELASFDSTDGRDIRASNIRLQPTAARFARSGG